MRNAEILEKTRVVRYGSARDRASESIQRIGISANDQIQNRTSILRPGVVLFYSIFQLTHFQIQIDLSSRYAAMPKDKLDRS